MNYDPVGSSTTVINYLREGPLWSAARMLACGRLVEEAKKYPGPVLVIAGTHDDITPAAGSERIARAFQRGTFRLLEGAGHLCFLDAPAVISSAITDMAQHCVEERIHERS